MEEKQNCREGIRSTLWIGIEEQQALVQSCKVRIRHESKAGKFM